MVSYCGSFSNVLRLRLWSLLAAVLVSVVFQSSLAAQTYSGHELEEKVEGYLKQMTLREKLEYIGGYKDFYIRPVPRLGLPAVKMSDGPIGVRNYGMSTQYPACIMLAATWNAELANQYGTGIGRDCRGRGVHILLGPGVNIYRNPLCGRNFEYTGEDPVLASQIAVNVIEGIQSQGVLATVKHFIANNQDYRRFDSGSNIDERTLREIYMPAFKAAVQKASVGCVMCAYNLLNGDWCSANRWLNVDILKNEWGFDGILMSDWGAVHEIVGVANGGLDIEMPSGHFLNPDNLEIMVRSGKVTEATIDDKVRRLLRTVIRPGFLTQQQKLDYPMNDPKCAAIALDVAREGVVLLKNDSKTLPLDAADVKKIVVMGPFGGFVPEGGGSSRVEPFGEISTVDGIKDIIGSGTSLSYYPVLGRSVADGISKSSVYSHVAKDGTVKPGLLAEYYSNTRLEGDPVLVRSEDILNVASQRGLVDAVGLDQGVSVRWSGTITPDKTGEYTLALCSDDGMRVWLDGEVILDAWGDHAAQSDFIRSKLIAGKSYKLKVEYYQNGGDAVAQFGWGVQKSSLDDAVAAAADADAVIVCVGFGADSEGEGSDHSFGLPNGQDELIKAASAANKNTVVVVHSGGNVDMQEWISDVPAILQGWYPGQAGGQAIAEILFGKVNPSGKLPQTYEKSWEDNPTYNSYALKDGYSVDYTEGIFVGYRGFEKNKIKPQFAFGHGLSYTTFKYGKPNAIVAITDGKPHVMVTFSLKNTGKMAGSEVPQVYLSWKDASMAQPLKALKGFAKVNLKPGESRDVTVVLDSDALSSYDVNAGKWVIDGKKFEVLVGSASDDIRGKAGFKL